MSHSRSPGRLLISRMSETAPIPPMKVYDVGLNPISASVIEMEFVRLSAGLWTDYIFQMYSFVMWKEWTALCMPWKPFPKRQWYIDTLIISLH